MKYSMLVLTLISNQVFAAEPESVVIEGAYLASRRSAEVPAQEEGPLTAVMVREGVRIERDTVIARIDDSVAQQALRRAELNRDIAVKMAQNKTALNFGAALRNYAESELRRAQQLRAVDREAVSDAELNSLQLELAKAVQQFEQAKSDLELADLSRQVQEVEVTTAQLTLQKRQIKAPFSGAVSRLYKSQGEWVKPGDNVARLVQLDQLIARAAVDLRHRSLNLDGAKAAIEIVATPDDSPEIRKLDGKKFPGRVVFIDPEIDATNGEFELWAEFENPQMVLSPGLRVRLIITPQPATAQRRPRRPVLRREADS